MVMFDWLDDFEARASRSLTIERADSRDRNTGGQSTGNRGGGGRTSGGTGATGGNAYAGYKGPVGTSNPTSAAPGSYGLSGPETQAYNSAKMQHAARALPQRVFDFFSPVHSIDPQINQPSSYAGGTYHYGFSPGGLAGGALGSVIPGGGIIGGQIGNALQGAAGIHDVVLTGPGSGFSTSYPGGGPGYNSSTGYAAPGQPSSPQGKMMQGGTIPQQAPGGAPFGPQPGGIQASVNPQTSTMFMPKIPNHSLPQGYQSAFPNSLSEEDKRLLYAKALGAM